MFIISPFSRIVLVAVQDSADTFGLDAIGALKRLGAKEPIILEFRSSFALAGFAGSPLPSWVSQVQNKRYKGPSVLLVMIKVGNIIFTTVFLGSFSPGLCTLFNSSTDLVLFAFRRMN